MIHAVRGPRSEAALELVYARLAGTRSGLMQRKLPFARGLEDAMRAMCIFEQKCCPRYLIINELQRPGTPISVSSLVETTVLLCKRMCLTGTCNGIHIGSFLREVR